VSNDDDAGSTRVSWRAARFVLGAILCAAGVMKLTVAWEFSESIANYRMLPAQLNQILGVVLPWWELGAGLLLLLGLWVRASALLSLALFGAFGAAVSMALARGLDIDCGCFGTGASGRVGFRTLVVDLMGLGLSLFVLRMAGKEAGEPRPVPAMARKEKPARVAS
jgi:uncharacterized membrane protein YphA (DoxX/SURF4 family)